MAVGKSSRLRKMVAGFLVIVLLALTSLKKSKRTWKKEVRLAGIATRAKKTANCSE